MPKVSGATEGHVALSSQARSQPELSQHTAYTVSSGPRKPANVHCQIYSGALKPVELAASLQDVLISGSLGSVQTDGFSKKQKDQDAAPELDDSTVCSLHGASTKRDLFQRATIRTVEATANAKIFFETYYDPLLAGVKTSRSLRRQTLEGYLKSSMVPEDQIRLIRSRWTASESEHLRRTRVQRSRQKRDRRYSGVSAAGFECLRVIGKGSFGVVRLVRESTNGAKKNEFREFQYGAQLGCKTYPQGTNVFAMKVIRKSAMLRNCQEAHLRAERDFLVASEKSRWVVPLYASFQDDTNLYLVMDYMMGGDFLGLLFRKNVLKERHTRWYIAEMILCVEETHRRGWIHRDVKPDNFLISSTGHLKISDFGLAFDGHWSHDQRFFRYHRKTLLEMLGIQVWGDQDDQETGVAKIRPVYLRDAPSPEYRKTKDDAYGGNPSSDEKILHWRNRKGFRDMAASIVGTSQYMAPEIIRGLHYDGRCDWWSIGIIMYEHHDTSLIFPRETPYRVSVDAIDLLRRLLRDKEHRLCSEIYRLNDSEEHVAGRKHGFPASKVKYQNSFGAQRRFVYPNDAGDIKKHQFFNGIVWKRHHLSRPPFVPDCVSKEDTKYFDEDPMSDLEDHPSLDSDVDPQIEVIDTPRSIYKKSARVAAVDGQLDTKVVNSPNSGRGVTKAQSPEQERERPRDKILRDKHLAKQALEIRKKGVFIGYTYRRPKDVLISEDDGYADFEHQCSIRESVGRLEAYALKLRTLQE